MDMGQEETMSTKIEWTDETWNPLRGCSRVSDGCKNCYAEKVAMRFSGDDQPYEGLVRMTSQGPKWTGKIKLVPEALKIPFGWAKPRRVFVNSMSDLFHESVPFEFIASVFAVMSVTSRHTYQVLTKRPARMVEFFRWVKDGAGCFDDDAISNCLPKDIPWVPYRENERHGGYDNCGPGFPYENVWLGVSVEDQRTANERIPLLLQVPAAVRFLSVEPLLGPVTLFDMDGPIDVPDGSQSPLHWVIVGGESGANARPMHPDWARDLRDQCEVVGVPFFFKQWGEWAPGENTSDRRTGIVKTADLFADKWMIGETNLASDGGHIDDEPDVYRVGKKTAGRHLDGRTHDEFPEAK
jgi:protein gp37